ncbi:MAG: NADH:ubiquinone reductase (Na(+)-transporting) subunit C [Planctomycetes bacterium]|nr:NADH:ubiquinone reductase (Na(+)-transporting) subunit C [Planctomycetota bacterium]
MNKNSNGYVLGFAVAVCVAVSTGLAITANALKATQEAAAEFDRQKNVMIAAGLCAADDPRPRAELEQLYADRVTESVVDTETGKVTTEKKPAEIKDLDEAGQRRFRVVATTKDAAGKLEAVVLPISGRGLWSTLYGYLALDADKNHVRGITFYKHGETPGLGGEVENPQWQAQWRGKTIFDDSGKLVSVRVKKGQVDDEIPAEKKHAVDGLSGATITSNGVTRFVAADLAAFEDYLKNQKQN